jgi:HEAT repeat protein
MTKSVTRLVLLVALILGTGAAWAQTSVPALLSQLKTAQGEDLMRVIEALGQSHDKRAVEPLLAIFDVRHTGMPQSRYIVVALGRLKDARAISALSDAWIYLKTNDLGTSEFPPEVVARHQLLREAIIDALGQIGGDNAIAILVSATRDDQDRVVEHACRALTRLRYDGMASLNCPH